MWVFKSEPVSAGRLKAHRHFTFWSDNKQLSRMVYDHMGEANCMCLVGDATSGWLARGDKYPST